MPLYKLKCKACNKVFEQISNINDRQNIKCECSGNTEIMHNEDNPICHKCGEIIDHPVHYYYYNNGKQIELCRDCKYERDAESNSSHVKLFEPYWHPNLTSKPVWVKSRKHLKELDKKYNMTSVY